HIPFERDVKAVVVNESGASVYSASEVARAEFPDYDVTVRGAVSIGRRLMDPLAELVKIDPKSIGVGQYQHDVNQNRLQSSLQETVESCVNSVGVEVNTASKELLAYVSGVGPALAKNIVDYRDENGPFKHRSALKLVPRFGAKAFEQAAGFLRIRDAENPLDGSAVHPESYGVVTAMAKKVNSSVTELMSNAELRGKINLQDFITEKVGLPTLNDIMQELDKPGRDPRQDYEVFEFDKNITSINDLKEVMVIPGIVTNITNFGCFVDVGVHQDGLVHVSRLANKFVKDPNEVVKLNQKVIVKIIGIEVDRKRITLSMKDV
ncbi:MAG: helix-hairpin-helix domain-containing protein, partial [Bacteroidales bacterium]|nr:helix-hairpin-helix domain-containing protein [Bacteroidales bacterium]